MLPVTVDTIRLTLHVLAACVWVGGQVVLAGLVPTARTLGDDAPKAIARAFATIAWPAYAVLVATGIWNLLEIDVGDRTTAYHATLGLKLLVVAASGVSAGIHATTRTRSVLAITGAVAGTTAIVAVLLGVQLARG